MRSTMERLDRVLRDIDAINREDPRRILFQGEPQPHEWVLSERRTAWLALLYPDASEALRVAVRAMHLRRWDIPRETFPDGRRGYLLWRNRLYGYHADQAEAILRAHDYDEDTRARVRFLISKRQLGKDPETQALEDVSCLAFLEVEAPHFAAKTTPEKLREILAKTMKKMSPHAREAARRIPLPPPLGALLSKILEKSSGTRDDADMNAMEEAEKPLL